MIRSVTVAQVMSWKPCDDYSEAIIRKLFGTHDVLTWDQILDLRIPWRDRLWVFLRMVDKRTCVQLACDYAEHVQTSDSDLRSINAIKTARAWLAGEATPQQCASAAEAASEAARAAEAAWAEDGRRLPER